MQPFLKRKNKYLLSDKKTFTIQNLSYELLHVVYEAYSVKIKNVDFLIDRMKYGEGTLEDRDQYSYLKSMTEYSEQLKDILFELKDALE